jgi:RNA polymerase sigma-70 factor (sigma-E family)
MQPPPDPATSPRWNAGPKGKAGAVRQSWEQDYVEFVRARQVSWHRQAFMLTGDGHRADDLVQQTCVDLFVCWRRAMAATDPDRYVRAMLVRTFLNERRRGWAKRVQLTGSVPDRPFTDRETDERTALHAALLQVPPKQRAVLVLRYLYDMSVAEVADAVGCSPGTVKSQAFHGLAALRRLLGDVAFTK